MKDDVFVANTKEDLKSTILSILGDMWEVKTLKYKTVVVKTEDTEIVVAGFAGGNFMVNWDNLIKAKHIFKNSK